MDTDLTLLNRYAQTRAPELFALLVDRYAPMVFAAAKRITGNVHDAEDVTQACFMDLAANAATVKTSLAGWLHTAAVHRATNLKRNTLLRRTRENQVMPATEANDDWSDIAPQLDEAMAQLPDELRLTVVQHFLQGRSQMEIAQELGLNQSTVSRRLDRALGELRDLLQHSMPAAGFAAMLATHAVEPVPSALVEKLKAVSASDIGASAAPAAKSIFASPLFLGGGVLAALLIASAITILTVSNSQNTTTTPAAPVAETETDMSQDARRIVNEQLLKLIQSPTRQVTLSGNDAPAGVVNRYRLLASLPQGPGKTTVELTINQRLWDVTIEIMNGRDGEEVQLSAHEAR